MLKKKFLLISFFLTAILAGLVNGQSGRIIKDLDKVNPAELWQPNKEGCVVQYISYFKTKGKKMARIEYNCQPIVNNVTLSQTEITADCSKSNSSQNNSISSNSRLIEVKTKAFDIEGDSLLYRYEVSGGQIIANGKNNGSVAHVVENGSNVIWDLSGVSPGIYNVSVTVDDGCGICTSPFIKSLEVTQCKEDNLSSDQPPPVICPAEMEVTSNKQQIKEGETTTFTANIKGFEGVKFVYNWAISSGEIISGQNTPILTVKAKPETAGQEITAVAIVGDNSDSTCRPASATIRVVKR